MALLRRTGSNSQANANYGFVLAQRGEYRRSFDAYNRALSEDNTMRVAADAMIELSKHVGEKSTVAAAAPADRPPPAAPNVLPPKLVASSNPTPEVAATAHETIPVSQFNHATAPPQQIAGDAANSAAYDGPPPILPPRAARSPEGAQWPAQSLPERPVAPDGRTVRRGRRPMAARYPVGLRLLPPGCETLHHNANTQSSPTTIAALRLHRRRDTSNRPIGKRALPPGRVGPPHNVSGQFRPTTVAALRLHRRRDTSNRLIGNRALSPGREIPQRNVNTQPSPTTAVAPRRRATANRPIGEGVSRPGREIPQHKRNTKSILSTAVSRCPRRHRETLRGTAATTTTYRRTRQFLRPPGVQTRTSRRNTGSVRCPECPTRWRIPRSTMADHLSNSRSVPSPLPWSAVACYRFGLSNRHTFQEFANRGTRPSRRGQSAGKPAFFRGRLILPPHLGGRASGSESRA